MNKLPTQKKT